MKLTKKELQNMIKEQTNRILKQSWDQQKYFKHNVISKQDIKNCFIEYIQKLDFDDAEEYTDVNKYFDMKSIELFKEFKRKLIKVIEQQM